jgi:hypothetical protein
MNNDARKAAEEPSKAAHLITIFMCGDVMTGRGIDRVFLYTLASAREGPLLQILPPRLPVIFFPAFVYSLKILIGHVDVNQLDAPGISLRPEGEDQYGIKVLRLPIFGPPGLDD